MQKVSGFVLTCVTFDIVSVTEQRTIKYNVIKVPIDHNRNVGLLRLQARECGVYDSKRLMCVCRLITIADVYSLGSS